MAKPKETPKLVRNPVDGTTLVAPAGGGVEAHFTCTNPGNPNVAVFALQVDGLPEPAWAQYEPHGVAPEGEETLILKLQPPFDAAEGEYDLRVTLLMDNAVLRPAITLTLQVAGSISPPVEPVMPVVPDGNSKSGNQGNSSDSAPRSGEESIQSNPSNDNPLIFIDTPDGANNEHPEDETPAPNTMEDPQDGATLTLRPGETLTVRFPVTNDMPRDAIYAIDHDRTPIVMDWIELTPDQASLPRNGTGRLGMRIAVPLTARPGDYSFAVFIGPVGGTQTTRGLVLSVLPTPAVKLAATVALVKVGPFARPVDFELKVSGDGNADTAFRIAVKTPQSAELVAGHSALSDRYETEKWRYLFDKELDNVGVEEHSHYPKRANIKLRVVRKGIWWFGFTENHRFHAAAVPVTEPTNCGKTANRVELTAMRWRLLPFPPFLLIPLFLFFFMIAAGGASEISVTNSIYQAEDGRYWVAAKGEKVTVQTEWEASPWDLVRLTGQVGTKAYLNQIKLGGGTYTDTVELPSTEKQFEEHTYQVAAPWGGAARSVTAVLVRTFDEKLLRLSESTNNGPTIPVIPDESGSITLKVPQKGVVQLNLINVSSGSLAVPYRRVKNFAPSSRYKIQYGNPEDSAPISGQNYVTIEMNPDQQGSDAPQNDEIDYVTVSAKLPLLHIKVEAGQ